MYCTLDSDFLSWKTPFKSLPHPILLYWLASSLLAASTIDRTVERRRNVANASRRASPFWKASGREEEGGGRIRDAFYASGQLCWRCRILLLRVLPVHATLRSRPRRPEPELELDCRRAEPASVVAYAPCRHHRMSLKVGRPTNHSSPLHSITIQAGN